MPTQRPRHMVTETDRLAAALDQAATLWPESHGERGALLRAIIDRGIRAVEEEVAASRRERLAAVDTLEAGWSDVWPANWRDEMRREWPD